MKDGHKVTIDIQMSNRKIWQWFEDKLWLRIPLWNKYWI